MHNDAHNPYVASLIQKGDWAGLLRYGLAHNRHAPAFEAAVEILGELRQSSGFSDLHAWVSEFQENRFELRRVPNLDQLDLKPEQTVSIHLMATFPLMILCEVAGQYPLEQQAETYRTGREMAAIWHRWGTQLSDVALQALAHAYSAKAEMGLGLLDSALANFGQALRIYGELAAARPEVYLAEVAKIFNSLGMVRVDLGHFKSAAASYEEAIAAYRQLAAAWPEVYLIDLATALNNLGDVSRNLRRLESAAGCCEEALAILRQLASAGPEVYWPYIAATLNNLGNAQYDLDRFEAAAASHGEALAIRRRLASKLPELYLPDVAMTLNNLGNVQSSQSHFESAVVSYGEALAVYRELAAARPEVYLQYVALTLNNLAAVQRDLNRFDGALSTSEEALAVYRQLAASRPEVYRSKMAMTLNNLGSAHKHLSRFEPALSCYEEALETYRQLAAAQSELYLPEVAATLNNLGIVEHFLGRFDAAAHTYEEALAIWRQLAPTRPAVYVPEVAITLNNLGNIQRELSRFESALSSFEEALAIRRQLVSTRPEVYLPNLATSLNNLGNVQLDLGRFETAFFSYEEALETYRQLAATWPEVYLPDVALTLNNLGNVQRKLGRYEAAAASYVEARQLYLDLERQQGTARVIERIGLLRNLSALVVHDLPEQGWPDEGLARKLLREAISLAEGYRGLFEDPRERIRVHHELLGLYAEQIRICLKCAELHADASAYDEALETAEASRSRSLLDTLAQQLVPEQAPLELREEFRTLQRDLRRAQRRLHQEWETLLALARLASEADARDGSEQEDDGNSRRDVVALNQTRYERSAIDLSGTLDTERNQLQRIARVTDYVQQRIGAYHSLVAQLRAVDPDFQPDRVIDSFRVADRARLFPSDKRTVFVYLQCLENRLLVLLLTPEGLQPVPLPGVRLDRFRHMAGVLASAQLQKNLAGEALRVLLLQLIPEVLADLTPVLTQHLLTALTRVELHPGDRLVLVPDDILGFLPLHAVPVTEHECLGDRYEVAYTRSLSVLQQCQQRRRDPPTRLFGVIDPTSTLAGPALEAALTRSYFQDAAILARVNHETLMEQARDADVFYWMGHSQFLLQVPYWSGLLLQHSRSRVIHQAEGTTSARGVPLAPTDLATFTDIDCGLTMEACSLAILSGCQSGLAISGKGNEPISLVSAFLNAGAKCVVASLWPVDDGACVLTMQKFLAAWRTERLGIAAALRAAQQWLRNLTAQELAAWADGCPELQRKEFRNLKQSLRWKIAQEAIDRHGQAHCPYDAPYYWAPFVAVGQAWET